MSDPEELDEVDKVQDEQQLNDLDHEQKVLLDLAKGEQIESSTPDEPQKVPESPEAHEALEEPNDEPEAPKDTIPSPSLSNESDIPEQETSTSPPPPAVEGSGEIVEDKPVAVIAEEKPSVEIESVPSEPESTISPPPPEPRPSSPEDEQQDYPHEPERDIGAILASRANNGPRLAQPRKPVRKGVKPPTRGEPAAFKLTTKTETSEVARPPLPELPATPPPQHQTMPPLPHHPHNLPALPPQQSPPSGEEVEEDRPKPRPNSPPGRPGMGGMPNFAAEALNVQLKKVAARPKPPDNPPNELPVLPSQVHHKNAPPSPPPVPQRPARPPRPVRPKSRTTSEIPPQQETTTPAKVEEAKQGFLHKRGGFFKNWKKRWFVIKGSNLYYYRSQKPETLRGVIADIYKVEKLLKDSKDFCFCIFTPRRNYHCSADSWSEVDVWVEKISEIIKK